MSWIEEIGGILVFIAMTVGQSALASQSDDAASVELNKDKSSITIHFDSGASRQCRLEALIEKAQLSYDGSAVIVSDVGYIPVPRLRYCGNSPVAIDKISDKVGFLVDVNLSARTYVSLEAVGTTPLVFVAIVAKLGSTRNIVSLPGAWSPRKRMSLLQEQAFPYDEERSGIIGKDGRHVSPAGAPDCSPNAYPGVWDIKKNERVVLTGDDADRRCLELFL